MRGMRLLLEILTPSRHDGREGELIRVWESEQERERGGGGYREGGRKGIEEEDSEYQLTTSSV